MLCTIGVILLILAIAVATWDACNGFVVRWRLVAIVAGMVLGLAFIASSAVAQHVHPDEAIADDKVAKFYDSWTRPPQRVSSCCSKKDCYAAQIRRHPTGGLEYFHKWSGTWAAIPPKVLESNQVDPLDSPNTENHVCANENFPEVVYCAVLGGNM